MKNTLKGEYIPINTDKYIGSEKIIYRSSWELIVFRKCDKSDSVINWASEPFTIPYYNPFTKKNTVYIPDILICYDDAEGNRHNEVWEIKPKVQTYESSAKRPQDKLALALNLIKWEVARKYCKANGLTFRVLTENEILK